MTKQAGSLRLRRSIVAYAALGIMIVGVAVALASVFPLYRQLTDDQQATLSAALGARARTVGEFLQRASDVALQVTSRSTIRRALMDYDQGALSQDDLVELSGPILEDARSRSEDVAGITRLDAQDRRAVTVGLAVPPELWVIPARDSSRASISPPVDIEGQRYLVVGAPILDRGQRRVGTDVLLFRLSPLRQIVTDRAGLGETGESLLAVTRGGQVELVFEPQLAGNRGEEYRGLALSALQEALNGERGVRLAGEHVVAFGPVPRVGWAMVDSAHGSELYAPIAKQLWLIGSVIAGLLLLGTLGTVVVIRPLTALAIHADELEQQVEARTLALEQEFTQRRKTEEAQRLLEQQVQRTQKLESLGVLAGGIAHDFNNLLVGILGNADLGLADLPHGHPACESLDSIATAARRAADLCRQLLAYAGKGKFVVQPLDLREVVDEMTDLIEVSTSKNAAVQRAFAEVAPISGDATQIRQIVMNLITNASEAIGENPGIITIATGAQRCDRAYLDDGCWLAGEGCEEGDYSYFEIADTGAGMDAETQRKIFDPFFTTKFTGRGLGLAAVLGIVRSHRGALRVYSEPGKGTTVKVLFPSLVDGEALPARTAPTEAEWRSSGLVLLVDDDDVVLRVGQRMLERLGFEVLTARDGEEALSVFGEHRAKIRCVILDLTMPKMDGRTAFKELRRLDPRVRVILSSGHNSQEVTSRFVGKGLAGFVQKPYRLADLSGAIRESLEAKS